MRPVDLPLKYDMQTVDTALVARQQDMTGAILLGQQIAGLEDKEVAGALAMDKAQWSRIKSAQAHFPQDRLMNYMDVCANEVPLIWLANKRGYELVPLQTEMERQLAHEREEKQRLANENALLRNLLIGRGS